MKFPVFAVEWGQNRESRIGKRGFFVVAGGGGSTKSGIQNGLVRQHGAATAAAPQLSTALRGARIAELVSSG